MKRRVLVCGATGFIGRNIAQSLAVNPEYEVFGTHLRSPPPDIPGMKAIRADLRDPVQVDEIVRGMDTIIQAAATTSGSGDITTRPYLHVTDNAVMNSLLFRSAHDHDVGHVVFFSCTVMYPSSEGLVRESDFDANAAMHQNYFGVGWTKVYMEKMCDFYARLGRTKYTAIRHSNIYGPHDKYDLERSHVFGATVTKVMECRTGRITVWGPGTEGRDLLYVSDLVDFVKLAMERQAQPFELVNVGAGRAVTIKDLVTKIIHLSGKQIAVDHDLSKPHIPTRLALDTTRARDIFRWQPATGLEEGIRKTLEWYRNNRQTIQSVTADKEAV